MTLDTHIIDGKGEREAVRIAVALRYSEEDPAPVVVASGRGAIAENIVNVANDSGVAFEENPLLADALGSVPVDETIPEEMYIAVAEVIGWVLHGRTRNDKSSIWDGTDSFSPNIDAGDQDVV